MQQQCATGCGRPSERMLCAQCLWEVEQALSEMPSLLHQLSMTLTRQSQVGSPGIGRAAEMPLPYDVRASQVLDQIRVILVGWVMEIYESKHPIGPACEDCGHSSCQAVRWHRLPADSLRAMARWLLTRLDVIAMHPAADDIHDEITNAAAAGWRAVDLAGERIFVGLCECGEWMYAKPSSKLVRCRGCERSYDVAASRERLWDAIGDRLMTVAEIVSWGVQLRYVAEPDARRVRNLLDKWVERKRIVAKSVNRHGRGMYPFGETLTEAMAATRAKAA